MDIGTLVAGFTALGLGGILTKLVENLLKRRSGKLAEEQTAWQQRDSEARARRKLEEFAHRQRLLMIARGIPETDQPTWPEYDTSRLPPKE